MRKNVFPFLAALLLLTHCVGEENERQPDVAGARNGVFLAQQLAASGRLGPPVRPGALLGVFSTYHLSGRVQTVEGARTGIDGQTILLFADRLHEQESFALLEQLGLIVGVDINDMLNRSVDRRQSLDVYLASLLSQLQESREHTVVLEQQLAVLREEQRTRRRSVNDMQRTLNQALRDRDYGRAGSMQQQVIRAQGELTQAEAELDRLEDILDIFDDLLEVGQQRYLAMEQNREVLIAGLTVVDVPGVEDIGLIRESDRREQRNRTERLYDPANLDLPLP